jgi:polar amino acid transport system ATP-binding protein
LDQSLSAPSNTPVIELRNIHKSYGDLDVIKGVDLTAHKGDVIALIGSSGSGKSTLLRCVNLLETAQQGDIVIGGEPVTWNRETKDRQPKDTDQVRRFRTNLSMVFQQFNLWSHLSILQNVIESPVTVLGRDKVDAETFGRALLDKVGIGDKADMYPSQLSGGQQQRAAIARALAMEPSAMLFDEPTSALDPETEAEVVTVIRDLAAEGRTMLLVTHDMKMAREVANHVIFLHQGVIEEQGTPEEVFKQTKSTRLQQFLSSTH